jgi:hypothetical protein
MKMLIKILKTTLAIVVMISLLGGIGYFVMHATTMDFESVCDKTNNKYTDLCDNVGKRAISQYSIINITDKDYGKIIGVAWRTKGSVISSPNQKKKRISEKNAYYYIIGSDKKGEPQFLRAVSETDTR